MFPEDFVSKKKEEPREPSDDAELIAAQEAALIEDAQRDHDNAVHAALIVGKPLYDAYVAEHSKMSSVPMQSWEQLDHFERTKWNNIARGPQ